MRIHQWNSRQLLFLNTASSVIDRGFRFLIRCHSQVLSFSARIDHLLNSLSCSVCIDVQEISCEWKKKNVLVSKSGCSFWKSRIPSPREILDLNCADLCTKTTLCSPAETIALEAVEGLFARSTVVSMQSDPQQGESSWTLLIRFQVSHDFRRSLSFRPLNNAFHPIKTFQIW